VKIQIGLCLPRDAQTVALVRSVAMAALERMGVTTECIDDIRLALSEACTNVIEHADTDNDYEVRLEVEDDTCSIRVIDTGTVLDPRTLARVMPHPSSLRGRGVALMTALTDSIAFENHPEEGTIVHLVKNLELDAHGPLARLTRSE